MGLATVIHQAVGRDDPDATVITRKDNMNTIIRSRISLPTATPSILLMSDRLNLRITPGVDRIVEINTITGGTGRFEGAKGPFTLERLLGVTTGFTSGSFQGTITSPGAAR
jgi:hypothetical protein